MNGLGALVPGTHYVYTQPLYDTMQLAAAAGPLVYRFFTAPLGSVLAGTAVKGYQHTNMIQAGVLEKGHEFVVEGLILYVRETAQGGAAPTRADHRVIHGGHLLFQLTQREFLRIPTAMVPGGGGELVYSSNITPAATEFQNNRGVAAAMNVWLFKQTVKINDQQAFSVDFTVPGTIAAVTDVTIALLGTLTRPVL